MLFLLLLCGKQSLTKQLLPEELQVFCAAELRAPEFVSAQDGTQLAYYSYAQQSNPVIVVLYPGPGLYGNQQYQWVAQKLQNEHNIGCYIFDIRGHGNSEGVRGDGKYATRIFADVSTARDLVKEKHPHAKIYLAGHSTGAGLLLNYDTQHKHDQPDGLILIAPYLGSKYKSLKEHKLDNDGFIKKTNGAALSLGTFFPTGFPAHQTALYFNYSPETLELDPLIVPSYSLTMTQATIPMIAVETLPKIKSATVLMLDKRTHERLTKKKPITKIVATKTTTQVIDNDSFAQTLQQTPTLIAQAVAQL